MNKEHYLRHNYESFYNDFINHIKNGKSINDIVAYYLIPPYHIINVLLKKSNDEIVIKAINEFYNSYKINEDKCLVISDTHIGISSEDEKINTRSILNAYNYAARNNIKNVIHLGDLIEGKSNNHESSYTIEKQVEIFKEIYNGFDNINTLLLLGNHDYNVIFYNTFDLETKIMQQQNIKLIGLENSYITFCDNIIKLQHNCYLKDYYWDTKIPFQFILNGHFHKFVFKEGSNLINVPALKRNDNPSGFLELTNEEKAIRFRFFNEEAEEIDKNKPKTYSKKEIKIS